MTYRSRPSFTSALSPAQLRLWGSGVASTRYRDVARVVSSRENDVRASSVGMELCGIAIEVLKDAQQRIFEDTSVRRKIRCFFSEVNPRAYKDLAKAVAPYHRPQDNFEIVTFLGEFENAVPEIKKVIGSAFPLIFIDPTGWTRYAFQKIESIFESPKCEVLINFMYDFINRFVASQDEGIIATINPILGGLDGGIVSTNRYPSGLPWRSSFERR